MTQKEKTFFFYMYILCVKVLGFASDSLEKRNSNHKSQYRFTLMSSFEINLIHLINRAKRTEKCEQCHVF